MNGLPYYKAYPRDFMEGTVGMPFELKGAYRLLLDLIYMHGGRLADDPRFIAGHLGCSVRAWNGYRAALIKEGKISVDLGIISNFRADKELIILRSFQEKQRQNAAGANKNKDISEAKAGPRASHTEPEPDIKREAIASPKKRACQLPDGWVPSDKNISDAQAKGFSAQEIDNEADRFRDHHTAKGSTFKCWDAAWRTWLGNARKFSGRFMAGPPSPGGYGQGSSIASIAARRRAAGQV
jgi:uncharacterized protein YdaU (DUF1376 family)